MVAIVLIIISLGVLIQISYPYNPNFNYITIEVKQNNSSYFLNNGSKNINVSIDICTTGNDYPFQLNISNHGFNTLSLGLFFISNYTGNESLHNASACFSQFKSISSYTAYFEKKYNQKGICASFYYMPTITLSNNSTKFVVNILKTNSPDPGIYGLLLNNISATGKHRDVVNTVYTNQIVVVKAS